MKVEFGRPGRAEAALRHAAGADRQPARKQILHGGVISAVLDVAAGFAIHLAVCARSSRSRRRDTFPPIGTIDLHVDYLRPGRGNYFIATGRVVRLGNRVAVAHMELVNDADELIATGDAAYMVSSA